MLIGEAVSEPREMPRLASSPGEVVGMPPIFWFAFAGGMPSEVAVSTICCGPSSPIFRVMSMKAVLIDSSVAVSRLTAEP